MADLAEMRRQLEDRRAELEGLRESSAQARGAVQLDQQSVGRISRMDAMQVQEMAKAQEARRRRDLVRIEMAERRIETGEYGYCTLCGDDIPLKRLELDPATPTCVACANARTP